MLLDYKSKLYCAKMIWRFNHFSVSMFCANLGFTRHKLCYFCVFEKIIWQVSYFKKYIEIN